MFQYILKNCRVLDGSGAQEYSADVGIQGDTISAIGDLSDYKAECRIEGDGLVLAPGFIDLHSHSDLDAALAPLELNKLSQGVTTECCGNCGFSLFPITETGRPAIREMMKSYQKDAEIPWSSGAEFYDRLERAGIGFNYFPLVGHGLLRLNALGFQSTPARGAALKIMEDLLAREMENGARGFSSGLAYAPGCFSDATELIALGKVAARYGGIYTSHIRNQGNRLVQSVQEAISIGREAQVPVIVSHLKAYGVCNWGKAEAALEVIERARGEGLRIIADFYPYDSASSTLAYELPDWVKEGGPGRILERLSSSGDRKRIQDELSKAGELAWDRVMICGVRTEKNKPLLGSSIQQIANYRGCDPFDAAFDLLLEESCAVETVCALMSQADVDLIAKASFTALGSDAYALDADKLFTGHPRNYGAFPKFFRTFVREKRCLSLQEAVRKTSGLAAEFLGLTDRGKIVVGNKADLVLFDEDDIADEATYLKPDLKSRGIRAVFVNGVLHYGDGAALMERPGRILTKAR